MFQVTNSSEINVFKDIFSQNIWTYCSRRGERWWGQVVIRYGTILVWPYFCIRFVSETKWFHLKFEKLAPLWGKEIREDNDYGQNMYLSTRTEKDLVLHFLFPHYLWDIISVHWIFSEKRKFLETENDHMHSTQC